MNFRNGIAREHFTEYPDWAVTDSGAKIACYSSYPLDKPENANPILLIGGVHGDEPEGVRLAEETLNWLRSQDSPLSTEWILIPCINPDGIHRGERTNGRGVDLNRNFPSSNWESDAKKPRYNPGPRPGSEKETQALVQLIEHTQPKLILHCHSWKPCVVYTGELGRKAAEALGAASGYPVQNTIGYDCPGSLGDYGGQDLGIPVVCIEAECGSPLETVWPRFEAGIQKIFRDLSV